MFAGTSLSGNVKDVTGWGDLEGDGVTDQPHVACVVFDGATTKLYIDDPITPVLTGNAGTLNMITARLGARFSDNSCFVGEWAALDVFSGVGSDAERTKKMENLKLRYGR